MDPRKVLIQNNPVLYSSHSFFLGELEEHEVLMVLRVLEEQVSMVLFLLEELVEELVLLLLEEVVVV